MKYVTIQDTSAIKKKISSCKNNIYPQYTKTISLQNNRYFMLCILYIVYTVLFFDSFFCICFISAMNNKYSKWLFHVTFTLLKQTGIGYA